VICNIKGGQVANSCENDLFTAAHHQIKEIFDGILKPIDIA